MDEKTMASIMQEEKEKLLAEIKKNINRKKMLMNQDDSETGFENFKRK